MLLTIQLFRAKLWPGQAGPTKSTYLEREPTHIIHQFVKATILGKINS